MKKIYILIFLLISGFGFGQDIGNYRVITKLNIRPNGSGSYGGSCKNDVNVDLIYNDGTIRSLSEGLSGTSRNQYSYFEATHEVSSNRKPVKIQVRASRNWRRTIGGCGGNGSFNDRLKEGSFTRCTNVYNDIVDWWDDKLVIENIPILTIVQPGSNNFLPVDENITIYSNTGFAPNEYNWEYSVNPDSSDLSGWKDLPQFDGQSSITTNATAILVANASSYHGRKIFFRQKACNVKSVHAEYAIRLSTPKILSATPTNVSCYDLDSQDGKLKIQFDRPLYPNENLSIDLFYNNANINKEHITLNSDNTYILEGLSRGDYELKLIGNLGLGTLNTYSPTSTNPEKFKINAPSPVNFTLNKSDILCYGAQNGEIKINVTGGNRDGVSNDAYSLDNGANWIPFPNNAPHTITGLLAGKYKIKVKDANGCVAREQKLVNGVIELGDEKIIEVEIFEPKSPLEIKYTFKKDPTFNGGHNGKIVAAITGGTIKDDTTYDHKWIKSTGEEFPTTTQYNSTDKTYNITLDNVPEGEYKLTVTDKNYDIATNKTGCSVIESSQVLIQPEPIVISLVETQAVSCNTENLDTNTDKFSDGILQATVTGGTLPYQYIWSKFNLATNTWDILEDQISDIATNLSKGNYALNVLDKNGITQGTYNTTTLVTAIPATKDLIEPIKLELSFESRNVSCHSGNNGWAKANVTGGKAPYTYTWYNVSGGVINENEISQLIAGNYVVEVTDEKGCLIKGAIQITEPQMAVSINYETIKEPTFNGATNGKIIAEITGGTPNDGGSYTYEWKDALGNLQITTTEIKDGKYSITLDGVPANDYFLTIKDKNYNEATGQTVNCSILESKVSLKEPDPLKVIFEIVRTISCNTSNEFGDDTDITPRDGQRDESQDGILVAHVSGGTPLAANTNGGLPYFYYWKKQQADGSWVAWNNNDETAENLSHGNYALNVKDRNGIVLGTYVNNQLTQEIDATELMQEPLKLSVSITKGDVFCNGGNDGWATANVVGGTPPYIYEWSNDVEIAENTVLTAGNYWVMITDSKGCTTQADITIIEPKTPVSIKYVEILNPSFYKASNGKIVVEVTGGTMFPDNSYWFEWKNSNGIVQTTATTNFNNGIYTISLDGLIEETYDLTVRDANYDPATNKTSCTVANSMTTLEDPDPLKVVFEVQRTISCNVSNEFGDETDANPLDGQRDESQDGILVAYVTGGIQLASDKNNGLPYFYTWKKQQADGSWVIWNEKDEIAENLSHGTYALNVEDANGIKLGAYVNNVLVKEEDVTQFMPEPAKLNLTFTKLNASCNNGDDGWAEAHVSGGTPPYTYEWTNGADTAKIENITTNNYFVIVTDAKGCVIQGSIFVGDPKGIFTTEIVKDPTCAKGNDGSIVLNVTGGNLPYTYLWNNGAITKDLTNLVAGNYEVTITCPDCCLYKKRFVLKDPNPIVIDLGKDRTLCKDQVLDIDATIEDDKALYNWTSTNGFSSTDAKVSLTKAGTYRVKVTSGLGCVGEDEIIIKTSQTAISSEFLLSSQAYLDEEVILVNTSNPFGENTEWILPKGVNIVEQKEKYITLKFSEIGNYTIGLQQTQGECYATFSKNITVEKRSTLPNVSNGSKFIIDFMVTPNPSDGNFKAIINLENSNAINLRLFATTGQFTTIQKKDSGKKKYEVDFNTTLESGMYILVLETEQQTLVKKIIIY